MAAMKRGLPALSALALLLSGCGAGDGPAVGGMSGDEAVQVNKAAKMLEPRDGAAPPDAGRR